MATAKMWKKLNRSKEPSIGRPTMIETTVDEGYLESIPEVDKARSPTSPDTIVSPTLPNLPFKSVEPLQPPRAAEPYPDRTSSVYSQPSPALQNQFPRESTQSSTVRDSVRDSARVPSSVWSDVSPPDSPRRSYEPYQEQTHGSPDVSPIEERSPPREPRLPAARNRSNLPIPKPAEGNATKKFWPSHQVMPNSQTTRWDEYSGEPTVSEKGQPSSVKPGQHDTSFKGTHSGHRPGLDNKPGQDRKTVFTGLRERDPAKRKQAMQRIRDDAMDAPPEREAWKGASGRAAIPPPVRSDPTAKLKPLQIPRNQHAVNPDTNKVGTSGASELARQTVRPVVPSGRFEEIKPTVPLKAGTNTPRNMSPTTPTYPTAQLDSRLNRRQSPSSAPAVMPPTEASASLPTPPGSTQRPYDPPLTTKQQQQHEAALRSNLASLDLDDQPSSRFSSTTYATTVNESPNSSPRASMDANAPPVPQMPSPVLMRKRPVPAATKANTLGPVSNAKATTRKPAPSDRGHRASVDSNITMMTTETGKDLPAIPPAMNRLDILNNELATLSHRRVKINNVLKDLNAVLNPTSVAYDHATRQQTKASVNKLEEELADIAREEHEIGLKAMRARRKLDELDGNWAGEGVLWVKRVTS